MGALIYRSHSALDYAKQACDAVMRKFAPEDLPPKGEFYYHQGVFLSGMQKIYDLCREEKYYKYIKTWVDSVIRPDGSIHHFDAEQLDYIQPGVLLFPLYEKSGDDRYRKALENLLLAVDNLPVNEEGGLWHNRDCCNQMWLDGLYMTGPICAQFANVFGENRYYDHLVSQALLMERKTKDTDSGLWCHACDFSRQMSWSDPETGKSAEFWGRAMGWVPTAVLEELEFLPLYHPGRTELIRLTADLLKAVSGYQDDESGLWYQVIDKGGMEGNWLESSCTCLFVGAICKAVRNGFLDKENLIIAEKGYRGIIDRVSYNADGIIIDSICVGTGVGNFDHYCARPRIENDLHGMGAFLLMCAEVSQTL
jgi:unsaturated rhamnogalacturonyl hydrolase